MDISIDYDIMAAALNKFFLFHIWASFCFFIYKNCNAKTAAIVC